MQMPQSDETPSPGVSKAQATLGGAGFDDFSFEDAFRLLEETVARLESGGLSLDDMIARFEEGMTLVKLCYQKLETAQTRVEMLIRDGEPGAHAEDPEGLFDSQDDDD